jgi:putative chitinase
MGQANNNFNPEFIKQAGEDKGIKMSLSQGEQLMLNHLVKAGFKDNKTLALALAMAKKETGGYSSTVENTNWSAPTLLKYFKNIPDAATAQKVAAMSPAERAMYVYGRAPKGPSLGNQKPEDGFTYRGRGLFQLTGKSNYEAFKKASGIDVVSNPRIVSEDPNVMAESAVWFLKNNKAMQSIAQTGDFDTAVRGINGGNAVPATDERRQFYNDYLNRLRSGDLTIAGGSDSPDAAAGDQKTMADGGIPAQTPEGADKNVPQDKATGTNNPNSTAVKPGDTAALIRSVEAGNKASNAGNTSSANASPMSQGPTTSTAPPVTAPATSGGGSTGGQSSSASTAPSPVAPTAPEVKAPSKQSPAKDVGMWSKNETTPPVTVDDTNVVGALSAVADLLKQIRDKLPEKDALSHVKV